ncbi:hypothetical protein [uncultured Leifsonia sp.]|uniref:hypothetical protein n=1 Tax=uncultured Leifsonia sp. TaxID=340359 RepID=UPI0028D275FE|nr:hypothetical protein [uncultured Leifsonia sp.]
MTGKTPRFNIPYPDGTTKAYKLGDELAAMAGGMEAALLAAGIPAVTNQDRAVANSDAARNAHFGNPSTEPDRLALQMRGAECVRPDRGWTERYFATFNAQTNPGGATTPGWYPVEGRKPLCRLTTSIAQGWATQLTPFTWGGNPADPIIDTDGMWNALQPTRINITRTGVWRVTHRLISTGTASVNVMVRVNGVNPSASIAGSSGFGTAGAGTSPNGSAPMSLKAGDYIELVQISPAAAAGTWNTAGCYFSAEFIHPA